MAGKLVLCRHGQSDWNLKNLFTGWKYVDLTEQGNQEAIDAGRLLRDALALPQRQSAPEPAPRLEPEPDIETRVASAATWARSWVTKIIAIRRSHCM